MNEKICQYCNKTFLVTKDESCFCSAKCRKKRMIYQKNYYQLNKIRDAEIHKRQLKNWRLKNKKHIQKYNTLWKKKNIIHINKYKLNRYHMVEKKDPKFIILKRMRGRFWQTLKSKKMSKNLHTKELFGCNEDFLRKYLESTFKSGMSWDLGRKIHIDHIIPCSAFNIENPSELKKCFHYTNLQVLWAEENLRKGGKHESTI